MNRSMDAAASPVAAAGACAAPHAFGPFRLLVEPLRLYRGEEQVRVGGRALDLLLALVSRPGEILSRAEIEAVVWPYSVVEDSSLRVHVAALRRVLGDGVGGARYIANVPARGYSFVAPVTRLADASLAAAPAAVATGRATTLPVVLTRLIGRDDLVRALSASLGQRRLTSIVGHGGIGKTALALAIAARAEHQYADGACFVDLAPLTAADHVVETVIAALGLPMETESHIAALETWIRTRRLLLVIDNCEHLLDAVAGLAERLLRQAPGLVILATSREPLDAEGEWVHRILPLDTPPEDLPIDGPGALGYSAVQLLAERAAASADNFEIDGDNASLAAALCRRLDGVPLAIEFAASRIGLLGLHGVCMQLDDRLRLLGSGRRTALPRHRTLRALLDWSYDLLDPLQQDVLRRCGVFKGGFTLEAALAVLADDALAPERIHDCLLDLVAKSLLRVDLAQSPPRYSLLEITRAYALERLGADSGRQAVCRRHAQYMVVLVQRRADEGSETLPQSAFLSYSAQVENFRAALEWCFGPEGDPAIGIALLATDFHPMALYLGENEYRTRARQALDAILAGTPADPIHEVRMFSVFHYISAADGDGPALERLHQIAERSTDAGARLEALYQLHAHYFGRGSYHLCEPLSRRSEQAALLCGEPERLHARRLRALALHYCGMHNAAADYAAALLYKDDQRVPLRLSGWLSRRQSMQIVMTRIFWMQGQGERAVLLAKECVRSAEDARFPAALSQSICLAAFPVAIWQGDEAMARALLERLEAHLDQHPQQYWSAWLRGLNALMALRSPSATVFSFLPDAPDAKLLDHLVSFGGWSCHQQALARWRQGMVGWNGPELLRIQGELLLLQGNPGAAAAAQAAFMAALALARKQQAHAWALRASNSLARLWVADGRRGDARHLLESWLPRLAAMGDSADAAETRLLLDGC